MAALTKRKKKNNNEQAIPFFHDPNIICIYEMKIGGEDVVPGTPLKVKGRRGNYQFIRLVHNKTKDVQWVDLRDEALGSWLAVRPEEITGLVYKKKSYRKKKVSK